QTNPGYLREFTEFWSAKPSVKRIWFSIYTPQKGERSDERLERRDRERAIAELVDLHAEFPKLMDLRPDLLARFLSPPANPESCIFARTTACVSSDLDRVISPCQFGGNPECSECGCMASAGLEAIGDRRLAGVIPIRSIYETSDRIGAFVNRVRA